MLQMEDFKLMSVLKLLLKIRKILNKKVNSLSFIGFYGHFKKKSLNYFFELNA